MSDSSTDKTGLFALILIPISHFLGGAVLLAILFFVVPNFESMMADMGAVLPIPTQITFGLIGRPFWQYVLFGLSWVALDACLLLLFKDDAKSLWMFLALSLLFIGVAIAFIFWSLYLPIFSMSSSIEPSIL